MAACAGCSLSCQKLGDILRTKEATWDFLVQHKLVLATGDGTFSFNEFVEIVCNMGAGGERPPEDEEKELRDAFKIFDKHERGYICASDLRAVLRCLGEDLSEEEIEDMIREVDIDGDGRIDFEEFVKALGEQDDDTSDEDGEGAEAPQE